jgi:Asp-tRNA(Asn)/Glu-tRNA(Gln) amidotransferase B subunit
MANLFRDYYNQFRQKVRNTIDNKYQNRIRQSGGLQDVDVTILIQNANLHEIFQAHIIDNGMIKSLKGNWGVNMVEDQQDLDDIKQGLVQYRI